MFEITSFTKKTKKIFPEAFQSKFIALWNSDNLRIFYKNIFFNIFYAIEFLGDLPIFLEYNFMQIKVLYFFGCQAHKQEKLIYKKRNFAFNKYFNNIIIHY